MDNLQKSEVVVARILTRLAEGGLKRSGLDADILGLDSDLKPLFEDCLVWLANEKIIRVGQAVTGTGPDDIYYHSCAITELGFELLGRQISLGGETKSLGAAVKDVSSGRSYSSLGDFFGGLLGGFTKSVSS